MRHVSGRASRVRLGAGADGAPVPEGGVGELPLRTRRAILERLCERAKPGRERTDGTRAPRRIQLVQSKVIDDPRLSAEQRKDQLLKYYARVVEIGGEGVIVKALDAPYCIGRFTKKLKLWVKLKPEYGNEGEVPRLDCVIVGGYWSEAMRQGRRGQLSQFVVALRKSAGADEDGAYYTFGRIGTGYRVQQLTEINEQLKDNLVGYDPSDPPPYFHPGWDPRGEDKPDKIVRNVSKSVVLEIKCGELVKSDQFSVRCTFRFPRVERIRHDKGAADVDVVQQARDIFARPRQVVAVGGGRGRRRPSSWTPRTPTPGRGSSTTPRCGRSSRSAARTSWPMFPTSTPTTARPRPTTSSARAAATARSSTATRGSGGAASSTRRGPRSPWPPTSCSTRGRATSSRGRRTKTSRGSGATSSPSGATARAGRSPRATSPWTWPTPGTRASGAATGSSAN